MRILIANAHGADLAYGGAERYVADLRTGLEQRGHDVTVLSAFPTVADDSAQRRVIHDSDWRDSQARRLMTHAESWVAAAPDRLEEVLRAARPDLVHTSNLTGIGTGLWERARRLQLPVVHTLHDYGLLCPRTSLMRRDGQPCRPHPLLCGLRTRRLARWAPAVATVIGVSAHVLARHADVFPGSVRQRVIHAALRPFDGPAPPPPAPRPAVLGFLGRLRTDKGVLAVLEAAPALRDRGVAVRVAGDGPLRDRVLAVPAVEYLGPLHGRPLNDFLAEGDVGIVPSTWEEPGLSLVALEWLAAGRPVIASGRGGLSELDALGGILTAAPDAAGIVGAVRRLSDPGRWQSLVDAVPRVDDDADVTRWLDDHESVYQEALAVATRVG